MVVHQTPTDGNKHDCNYFHVEIQRGDITVMKVRKVTLIEPRAPGYHVYSRVILPRLGLPLLGAMLKARGCEVKIFCQEISGIDYDEVYSSDFVGISTTTSTVPEAYRIADKARDAGVPVMMGGSHVTFLPDEALEHADYCVRGEGEETLIELVEALESGSDLSGIKGLSYRKGSEIIHNPDRGLVCDLDSLPFPDFSLIQDSRKISMVPVATSRGCPFGCNFCSVTRMFGRGYRFRSVDNVIEELRQLSNSNVLSQTRVFFYDDNFAAHRAHTKELLRKMIATGVTPGWTAQVRSDVAQDPELLDLMRRSNCYYVYIGFESVNPETLEEFDKGQKVEEIVEAIRIIHKHGIMIHGMFVLGSENDTVKTIRDTVNFALKHKIDTVQLASLTPLPGTPYFQKMEDEGRLLTREWSLYDGLHVVYRPKKMSPPELQKEMERAIKRFYSIFQCMMVLVRPDSFVLFLNILIGRWRKAGTGIKMRFHGWFYRAYGHVLAKRVAKANKDFAGKISRLAESTRDLTKSRIRTE